MSERAEKLDQMDDNEAIICLEAEFPGWMVYRAVSGLCIAQIHDAPERRVQGEKWVDLRDEIIREIWRHQWKEATPPCLARQNRQAGPWGGRAGPA